MSTLYLDPVTKAAAMGNRTLKGIAGQMDLMGSVRMLQACVAEVQSGDMKQADAMMVAQAYTLDAVMAECLRMWMANQFEHPGAAQEYLRLAFKAQSQTRATWESLSKIKNPASPTFVRQANIANGPQQVNNGTTHGESAKPPIEVLEPKGG